MKALPIPFRGAALAGAAALSLIAAPAAAQEEGGGTTVMAGVGAQVYPKFVGSDDYGVYPMWILGFRRTGSPLDFEAPGDGIGITILPRDSFINFGPSVEFVAERQQDDVGFPVGDVGFTVEAGGFVEIFPTPNFRLRAEVRQGIGGHEGLVADLSADFVIRDRDTYVFSVGPRARWGDNGFHDAYFGVPVIPSVPVVPGPYVPPAYDPGSGIYSYGAAAGLTYKLGRNWGMQGYLGYDRLVGDAADSPIVRPLGSRDQFSGGLGLFYEFTL